MGGEDPYQLFQRLATKSWPVLVLSLLTILLSGLAATRLIKDTSADSLVGMENPARRYKERVAETFHLTDPIVVALVAPAGTTIYSADILNSVATLTERVRALALVDPERVVSLTTENAILGSADGLTVVPLAERSDASFDPAWVRANVARMPLYQGSLVARDERATVIVAGLLEQASATAAYQAALEAVESVPLPDGVQVHVAGDGAVSGYLSTYVDEDTYRLLPLAALIIAAVLLAAFRSLPGLLAPNLIVVATLFGTVAMMALTGTPFYVITIGLVVNLIGISVADAVHVLSQHRTTRRLLPEASAVEQVARTMSEMWRPVALTTLTTSVGFVALAVASDMAPVRAFGFAGAFGVVLAWVFTMTALPAVMTLWPERIARDRPPSRLAVGAAMARVVLARPGVVTTVMVTLMLLGLVGAAKVVVDDAWIDNFEKTEKIYLADRAINSHMDGVNFLDVYVEADEPDALLQPDALHRIDALQKFLVGLEHVNGATSYVDYVKTMNKVMNGDDPHAYAVPADVNLAAQLLLLYGLSADPTDLEEEIDASYRQALVRAAMDRAVYQNNDIVVPALEAYLLERFNTPTLTGTATGRVVVDYVWVRQIADSHVYSVLLALGSVFVVCLMVFRSVTWSLLAVLPVAGAVLSVYLVMGFGGIPLGVGTSMFAAIAIGLGIDFAIHTLHRINATRAANNDGLEAAIALFYQQTGGALFVNFLVVALGFGVLMLSSVPPLVSFGMLVAAAISGAWLMAVVAIPAILKLMCMARLPAFRHVTIGSSR